MTSIRVLVTKPLTYQDRNQVWWCFDPNHLMLRLVTSSFLANRFIGNRFTCSNKKLYSMSLKLLGNPLLLVVLPWESLHRNKEPWSSTLPPAPPSPAPSDGRMRMRRVRSCVSKVCSSSARPLTVGGSQGSRGRVSPGRRRRPAKEDGKKR